MNPLTEPMTDHRVAECERHGPYPTYRMGNHWAMCPQCYRAQISSMRVADLSQIRAERLRDWAQHLLSISGVPGRYQRAVLTDLEPQHRRPLAQFVTTVRDVTGGVLLRGGVGTGKTYAACALVRAVCDEGILARYCRAFDLAAKVKATWGTKDSEAAAMGWFREPRLLVIDEIGLGTPTDADRERLHDLLDWRYAEGLPTALATNLDTAGLRDYLGIRGSDRMREGLTTVTFSGASRRGGA